MGISSKPCDWWPKGSQSLRDQIPIKTPMKIPWHQNFSWFFVHEIPIDFPMNIPKGSWLLGHGDGQFCPSPAARFDQIPGGFHQVAWWWLGYFPKQRPDNHGDSDRNKNKQPQWKKWKLLEKKRSGIWNLLALKVALVCLPNKPSHWPHKKPMSILHARWLWNCLTNIFLDWVTSPTKYGGEP